MLNSQHHITGDMTIIVSLIQHLLSVVSVGTVRSDTTSSLDTDGAISISGDNSAGSKNCSGLEGGSNISTELGKSSIKKVKTMYMYMFRAF